MINRRQTVQEYPARSIAFYQFSFSSSQTFGKILFRLEKTVNAELEKPEVLPVLQGYPLPQASKTVDFILNHLEEYRAIMGPKGEPRLENRRRRNIADSFRDRFLKEKETGKAQGRPVPFSPPP